jgi:hypothetical protein
MIPTTQLVKAFPCPRKSYLDKQFYSSNDINYPLVLGNIIHEVFQSLLAEMDFRREKITQIIKEAIKPCLLQLYSLKKLEKEAEEDAR